MSRASKRKRTKVRTRSRINVRPVFAPEVAAVDREVCRATGPAPLKGERTTRSARSQRALLASREVPLVVGGLPVATSQTAARYQVERSLGKGSAAGVVFRKLRRTR